MVCNELINIFRSNPQLHERYDNNAKPNFTQLNFTANRNLEPVVHDYLVGTSMNLLRDYREIVPETDYWPKKYAFEEFRIKHYTDNGIDQFEWHVDSISLSTSKRFLAFFWYLNDVEEGGTTEFPNIEMSIVPKQGRAFIFPPLWLYPHKGSLVKKGEKFLLSSYLHYAE
jgi:hypothetical protein